MHHRHVSNFSAHVVQINDLVPLEFGIPIYGYLLPVVVTVTVITNTFIVLVLSDRSLRTPTNKVLLGMAVTELLTGLCSLPWLLYYYTFGGFLEDQENGMPSFWCRSFPYFSEVLPTVFHTAAIWMTVLLAVQRYCYVSSLRPGQTSCLPINASIIAICTLSAAGQIPLAMSRSTFPVYMHNRTCCFQRLSNWVTAIGYDAFYSTYYWLTVVFVYAGPCLLLALFGGLLMYFITKAEKHRRKSFASASRNQSSLHSKTKMLLIVIILFLITEFPAAVIFTMHVLIVTLRLSPMFSYRAMNIALILRNAFILISYPFNFAVYLSMSNQFRDTAIRLIKKYCLNIKSADLSSNSSTGRQFSYRYTVSRC